MKGDYSYHTHHRKMVRLYMEPLLLCIGLAIIPTTRTFSFPRTTILWYWQYSICYNTKDVPPYTLSYWVVFSCLPRFLFDFVRIVNVQNSLLGVRCRIIYLWNARHSRIVPNFFSYSFLELIQLLYHFLAFLILVIRYFFLVLILTLSSQNKKFILIS